MAPHKIHPVSSIASHISPPSNSHNAPNNLKIIGPIAVEIIILPNLLPALKLKHPGKCSVLKKRIAIGYGAALSEEFVLPRLELEKEAKKTNR